MIVSYPKNSGVRHYFSINQTVMNQLIRLLNEKNVLLKNNWILNSYLFRKSVWPIHIIEGSILLDSGFNKFDIGFGHPVICRQGFPLPQCVFGLIDDFVNFSSL